MSSTLAWAGDLALLGARKKFSLSSLAFILRSLSVANLINLLISFSDMDDLYEALSSSEFKVDENSES